MESYRGPLHRKKSRKEEGNSRAEETANQFHSGREPRHRKTASTREDQEKGKETRQRANSQRQNRTARADHDAKKVGKERSREPCGKNVSA